MSLQTKTKVNKIINILSQWAKKPSLDHDISSILNEYNSLIINGVHNFSETALIIQHYATIYEKKVSILHKEIFSLSFRLCEVMRPPVPESVEIVDLADNNSGQLAQMQASQLAVASTSNSAITAATTVVTTKKEKPERKKRKYKLQENTENSMQIPISDFPPEILESLNINNCNIEEILSTCREKLTPSDPLYSVFVKNSSEINRKNTIIRKGIELRENSWFQFQFLEVHLEKNCINNNITDENIVSENTDNSLGYHSMQITQNSTSAELENQSDIQCTVTTTASAEMLESGIELNSQFECTDTTDMCTEEVSNVNENTAASTNDICETTSNNIDDRELQKKALYKYKVNFKEVKINLIRLSNNMLLKYESLAQSDSMQSDIDNIIRTKLKSDLRSLKVNLFQLPDNVLSKIHYFKLSNEYLHEKKKRKLEKRTKSIFPKQGSQETEIRKRKQDLEKECVALTKRLKSYDLQEFENFEHSYNVSQGLCVPIPDKIDVSVCRKSVDNRSEVSYGCPVTPDSGRASMFHTDSETEHLDLDGDHDTDHDAVIRGASRADSGCVMSPHHESNIESIVPYSSEPVPVEENSIFEKLKQLYPRSFSDPSRAEYLKKLIELPGELRETENYLDWKRFIDDKTAEETEFNIHQYGTHILNSFKTKSKDEVVDFKKIVENKSVEEISKYFVSVLQLANTENIDICNEHPGEVYKEGLKLIFLKDERPHEMFEEEITTESEFRRNLPSTSSSTPYNSNSLSRTSLDNRRPVKRRRIDCSL